MEEDSRSDSGVSTLRSDGARSSGDERSGSRSSAVSDERSAASAEPDIKIVGTVERTVSSQYYRQNMSDRHNLALPPTSLPGLAPAHSHYPAVSPHLVPQASAAALLQYSQLSQLSQYQQHLAAAAALGINPESLPLLKQNYPGLHPATDLLLERERQIAQERDRALR